MLEEEKINFEEIANKLKNKGPVPDWEFISYEEYLKRTKKLENSSKSEYNG